jgi:hypothetical protein
MNVLGIMYFEQCSKNTTIRSQKISIMLVTLGCLRFDKITSAHLKTLEPLILSSPGMPPSESR